MLGTKRNYISILVGTVLFISILNVLGNSAILSIPNNSVDGLSSSAVSIEGPVDFAYEYSATGNTITWTITDGSGTYLITLDGEILEIDSYTSGVPITINVDGLGIGASTYDISAGGVNDSVIVNVYNLAPVVSSPDDIEYEEGETGNTIAWTVTDNSITIDAQYIVIELNGEEVESGYWVSGDEIIINVDGLDVGTNIYTITADDGIGGQSSDSVTVTVNEIQEEPEEPCHPRWHWRWHGHCHPHWGWKCHPRNNWRWHGHCHPHWKMGRHCWRH
jgi:hypothetical protein